MGIPRPGRALFALSIAAAGAFTAGWHGFAAEWLPREIAGHAAAAAVFGASLLAGGLLLLVPFTARLASLALSIILLLPLALQIPHVAAQPLIEAVWEDTSEKLAFFAGAWTIFSSLRRTPAGSARAGRILFALALPAIGVSHMVYLDHTAPLIPSWLPYHVPLAYLTGAAHIAAGIGILSGLRLAAILETVMTGLFTLLIWVPAVATQAGRSDWSELCVSAAITGAAWVVADSFRDAEPRG